MGDAWTPDRWPLISRALGASDNDLAPWDQCPQPVPWVWAPAQPDQGAAAGVMLAAPHQARCPGPASVRCSSPFCPRTPSAEHLWPHFPGYHLLPGSVLRGSPGSLEKLPRARTLSCPVPSHTCLPHQRQQIGRGGPGWPESRLTWTRVLGSTAKTHRPGHSTQFLQRPPWGPLGGLVYTGKGKQ